MAFGPYSDQIIAAAKRYGINPVILAGLIQQESLWDPKAVADNGQSFGLGQLNTGGALKVYGLTGEQVLAMSPEQQIDLVADFYKKNLIVAKGDDQKALRLYNGGGDPNYVEKVIRRIDKAGLGMPSRFAPVPQSGAVVKMPTGLNPEFKKNFSDFQNAAYLEGGHVIKPGSTFRTKAQQAQLYAEALTKYGTPAKARKKVAPPGHSSHEFGLAMDLTYSSPEARKWALQNAKRFNLVFRVAGEPWHIEPLNARDQIAGIKAGKTENTFGNQVININNPAGFHAVHMSPLPGFSPELRQLLTGDNPMNGGNPIDPNMSILGQLLNAQQTVGQRPSNDLMSRVMGDPLLHIGLGIMSGKGSFAQQLGAGALAGMRSYMDYQSAAEEAKLSNVRLGLQAMNAQTSALGTAERIRQNRIKETALTSLPEDLQGIAQLGLAGIPEDIRTAKYLEQTGMPPEQAATTAATGKNPGPGSQIIMMGEVPYWKITNPDGSISTIPLTPEQQQQHLGRLFKTAETKESGTVWGKEIPKIQMSMARIPEYERAIARIDDFIRRFKAPDVPMSGPYVGEFGASYNAFLADLKAFNIKETLEMITQSQLAPVSNVDVDFVSKGVAGPGKTKEVNLRFLNQLRSAYMQRMKHLQGMKAMRSAGMEWPDIFEQYADPSNRPNIPIEPPTTGAPSAYTEGEGTIPTIPQSLQPFEGYKPPGPSAPLTAPSAPAAPSSGLPPPGTREVQPDGSVIIW